MRISKIYKGHQGLPKWPSGAIIIIITIMIIMEIVLTLLPVDCLNVD